MKYKILIILFLSIFFLLSGCDDTKNAGKDGSEPLKNEAVQESENTALIDSSIIYTDTSNRFNAPEVLVELPELKNEIVLKPYDTEQWYIKNWLNASSYETYIFSYETDIPAKRLEIWVDVYSNGEYLGKDTFIEINSSTKIHDDGTKEAVDEISGKGEILIVQNRNNYGWFLSARDMSNMRPVNSPKASQGYLNLKSNTPGNEKWVKTYNNYDMYPEMFDGTTIKIEPDKDIILDCISKVKYGNNDLNEASEKLIEMVENPEMITENDRIEDVFKESTLTMLVKCRFITE